MNKFKKYMEIVSESEQNTNSHESSLEGLAELLNKRITEFLFNKKTYLKDYFTMENGKLSFRKDFDMKNDHANLIDDLSPFFIYEESVEINKYILNFKVIADIRKNKIKEINDKIAKIEKEKDIINDDLGFLYTFKKKS
jgi:hypothetical protein